MKRLLLALALLVPLAASADEGMWMIHALNQALEKKMQERGLQLSAGEIYNADAPGATVSDAVVSLGFYCTASVISDEGLLITNHHCAYSDLFDLSTPEKNYLEDGYWAFFRQDEIPLQGKEVYFLKRVLDVTDEVAAVADSLTARGERFGSRKLTSILERRYAARTGLEASLNSMWAGEKYYLALYTTYKDIRLVGAPPVSIAAFGGDEDNWEWPQHKGDFALYRIYDHGEPLHSPWHLRISRAGYREGDYAMVIGYPGRTDRYSSSYKVDYQTRVERPVTNRLRGNQMEILPVQRPGDAGRGSAVRETFRRGGREAGPGAGSPAGYPAGARRRVRRHRGHRTRKGLLPRDNRPRHAHHADDASDVQRQDA